MYTANIQHLNIFVDLVILPGFLTRSTFLSCSASSMLNFEVFFLLTGVSVQQVMMGIQTPMFVVVMV